jgi:nitroreductase
MEKIAETRIPIEDALRRRWSPRAFLDQPVEPEKLVSLLEAARWAASSRNEQPWAFVVARRDSAESSYADLLGTLASANRAWAQKAPVLILTLAHTRWEKEGTPNRHSFYDLGQAIANLVTQATALGLHAHQMGGFDVEAARAIFHIPDGWEPVSVIALGYRAEPETLPETMLARELEGRRRKSLEEFVFSGNWGNPATFSESNG